MRWGWRIVLVTTFLIDHFRLFGLRQVWNHFRRLEQEPPEFQEPALYQYVRHPLYFGFLLGCRAIPEMSLGHLLFAAASTGYILVVIPFEERDLLRYHGEECADYRVVLPRVATRFYVSTEAPAGRQEPSILLSRVHHP